MNKLHNKIERKFVESFDVSDWEVETTGGWVDVQQTNKTIEYDVWRLETKEGKWLECADNHIVYMVDGEGSESEVFVKDLKTGMPIRVSKSDNHLYNHIDYVSSVRKLDKKEHMYDLSVGGNHTYFVNDILSHNTMILSNIAVSAVKSGKNVLYITFEIDQKELRKRLDSAYTDLSLGNIFHLRDEVKKRIIDAKENGGAGRFFIKEFPPASVSALQIETFIHSLNLKKKFRPDIIVLDYLGIMVPISMKSCNNSYEKGKAICEEIRALSDRLQCPVISAAQTNRCLSLETNVYEKRKKQIQLKELEEGDEIKNNEGYVVVEKIFPTEKQKCYKIKTESGKEIICSSKHEFPTKNGLKSINSGLTLQDELIID